MENLYIEKFLFFLKPYLLNFKYNPELSEHYLQPTKKQKQKSVKKSAKKSTFVQKHNYRTEKENSLKRVSNQSRNERKS